MADAKDKDRDWYRPELPFRGPIAIPPTRPKWLVWSWRVMLAIGIIGVLIINGYVLVEFFK
jgi:hypothetical protein